MMSANSSSIEQYLRPGRRAHLVGIGGVSMRPLGLVLRSMGMEITGSDMNASVATEELQRSGITVYIGHREENIEGADCVIRTAAANNDNPEIAAARAAGVRIVTGDTKGVERGKGDGIYINTAGAGVVRHGLEISPSSVRPGDSVLVSGDLGRHGMTIMSLRAGLSFGEGLESDSAPLHESVAAVVRAGIPVHCLRDVTRGGLTATLSEIAESSGLTVKLDEVSIPVREDVRAACGLLGLDPLQVACEGRYLAILPREHEEEALRLMRGCGVSAGACAIGRVEEFGTAPLLMTGQLGVERVLGMPSGMQLPRIC